MRQDKFKTNKKIKQKQKEQRLGIHELLYKIGAGSGALDVSKLYLHVHHFISNSAAYR